jgi:hypothetical protein
MTSFQSFRAHRSTASPRGEARPTRAPGHGSTPTPHPARVHLELPRGPIPSSLQAQPAPVREKFTLLTHFSTVLYGAIAPKLHEPTTGPLTEPSGSLFSPLPERRNGTRRDAPHGAKRGARPAETVRGADREALPCDDARSRERRAEAPSNTEHGRVVPRARAAGLPKDLRRCGSCRRAQPVL